jgi:hypothetical protein
MKEHIRQFAIFEPFQKRMNLVKFTKSKIWKLKSLRLFTSKINQKSCRVHERIDMLMLFVRCVDVLMIVLMRWCVGDCVDDSVLTCRWLCSSLNFSLTNGLLDNLVLICLCFSVYLLLNWNVSLLHSLADVQKALKVVDCVCIKWNFVIS